jgi:hypothetical protein
MTAGFLISRLNEMIEQETILSNNFRVFLNGAGCQAHLARSRRALVVGECR